MKQSATWVGICLATLCVFLTACSHLADKQSKKAESESWPGIAVRTETQTNPPLHLFIAEVDLTNPRVHVRVAPGGPDPDGACKWQTVLMEPTKIAAREHFDLVVNGDFFNTRRIKDAQGTNSHPDPMRWGSAQGPAVTDGFVWATPTNKRPCLVVHKDGSLAIKTLKHASRDDWEVVAGSTMLVENGALVTHTNTMRHPRTCVGLNAARTKLIILVVDGRKPGVSIGMTFDELGATMLRLGCHEAVNLDGGGSTVMAVRNAATGDYRILNVPSDGHERPVADVLGISVEPSQTASAGH